MLSFGPVGVTMNQKRTLTILTIQIAAYKFNPSRSINFHGERGLIFRDCIDRLRARMSVVVKNTVGAAQ